MANSPTVYPMRGYETPAPKMPTSIDDLLPSTYMGQPTPFTSQMQNVGKMLQAKQDDSDAANNAALKFGPTVMPGQIAALNRFLFQHDPGGQQFGGVMDPTDSGETLQVPGAAPATPFNTGGQLQDQSQAQIEAAQEAKANVVAQQQALALQKLQQADDHFQARGKQRDEALLQQKLIADTRDHTIKQMKTASLAFQGKKLETYNAAVLAHGQASTYFGNAKALNALIQKKEDAARNSYNPTEKAALQDEIKTLHDQADTEYQKGLTTSSQASDILNGLTGSQPNPVAPRLPAPAAARPATAHWYDASELAGTPGAAMVAPGKTGVWIDTATKKALPY